MKDERFSDARILHFAYNSDWLVDACFESARDIGLRLIESLIEHRKNHPVGDKKQSLKLTPLTQRLASASALRGTQLWRNSHQGGKATFLIDIILFR